MRVFSLSLIVLCLLSFQSTARTIELGWIGSQPQRATGASFGVPFEKGLVQVGQHFQLGQAEESIPLQTWPMAYWPDGSVKWMGFATAGTPKSSYQLKTVDQSTNNIPTTLSMQVDERAGKVIIRDGELEYILNKSGANLIESIRLYDKIISREGQLTALMELRDPKNPTSLQYEEYRSNIHQLTVEQSGPVRVVVKVDGFHRSIKSGREFLPFSVRLYFYKDIPEVRIVHSFVYDGDQDKDFIKGLGISFAVPFRETAHNRHVHFSGEDRGLWSEPVKPIVTRSMFSYQGDRSIPMKQMAGERVPEITVDDERAFEVFRHLPEWDSYKLTQLHPDAFSISKRSNDYSSWLHAGSGGRSSGFALVGDVSGALAVGIKDFWQSYPASLEVKGARSKEARLHAWFWSPDGEAMDLRHYDTIGHDLLATYEDIQEGMSTPYGVARSSELTLYILDRMPTKQEIATLSQESTEVYQISCTPEYLHQVKAFGTWSLPDRSNDIRVWIENQLDSSILFYQRAIDEHRWYGFWNYGDVMHTYDASRHKWRYDIGGYAWANTELAPGHWLWYSYLRTGRADIFRMAEAMTRHTGEVDTYHIGEMKGLGTRHNVTHWGCGAKEARIGQAAWKRHHYYLTTDERSGDLMRESLDAEESTCKLDPLRIAQPRERFPYKGPARLRWGPDWLALAGNWFTEWERTGNRKYYDKIVAGLESLSHLPDNLFTGPNGLSYDPATGKLSYEGESGVTNRNHLATIMGGYEILDEIFQAIDHPAFRATYAQYGKFYGMPADDPARTERNRRWGNIGFQTPRLAAFAAHELNDDKLAERAWTELLGSRALRNGSMRSMYGARLIEAPDALYPIHENPRVGTNGTSQWGLNAIIMLELVGDWLDKHQADKEQDEFDTLINQDAKLIFDDTFKRNWKRNWFLDGKKAKIQKSDDGIRFYAGPNPASDADHSVLWTKEEFSGDIRVEFDFVRRDAATKFVNIVYLFAQGSGDGVYEKDIYQWRKLREVPAMRTYFNNMNLYHISFAAFENDNEDPNADYIRARRYLPAAGKGLTGTDLLPEYLNTGFFKTGDKHHITLIRKGDVLYMEVGNQKQKQLYKWKTDAFPALESGRIGLRLMGSRVSDFSNFRVYQL